MNTIEKEEFGELKLAFQCFENHKGVGILEFIKIFFELNDFKLDENLFHLLALIELY